MIGVLEPLVDEEEFEIRRTDEDLLPRRVIQHELQGLFAVWEFFDVFQVHVEVGLPALVKSHVVVLLDRLSHL